MSTFVSISTGQVKLEDDRTFPAETVDRVGIGELELVMGEGRVLPPKFLVSDTQDR